MAGCKTRPSVVYNDKTKKLTTYSMPLIVFCFHVINGKSYYVINSRVVILTVHVKYHCKQM